MDKIIINADDFGLHRSCSEAIIEAFGKKLISSSTMCANGRYFNEASKLAKESDLTDMIGIHLNLTEGEPLTDGMKKDPMFCDESGLFHNNINRLKPLTKSQRAHLSEELAAQIEKMRSNGFSVTHADSHHHIHTGIFISPVCLEVLKKYGIKIIRLHRNIGHIALYKRLMKRLYNHYLRRNGFQTVDFFGSLDDFTHTPATDSNCLYEIMVHPDYDDTGKLIDKTGYERSPTVPTLGMQVKSVPGKLYSYRNIYRDI